MLAATTQEVLESLGIALGLGLLVGLQREYADSRVAGIRTFALIALLGALCGTLTEPVGAWLTPAGLLAVGLAMLISNLVAARSEQGAGVGATTEIACLVVFLVGAAVALGYRAPAVVTTGAVAVLLHWKRPLHDLVDRIGEGESRAIFRLVLIALVILPVLPDEDFGPYEVLNAREIWLMVVLIVGISMAGYVAYRALGVRGGTVLAGALGGLISSTAATVGYSRQARSAGVQPAAAAILVMLASTVAFARVIVEIAIVAPGHLAVMAPPLAAVMGAMIVLSTVALLIVGRQLEASPEAELSADLKGALVFGALYALVLLGVAFSRDKFGDGGLYVVATISGLTDVDAITLSTAQLVKSGQLTAASGWRAVLIASLANLFFKAGLVAVLGPRAMFARVALLFFLSSLAGAIVFFAWP